MTDPIVKNDCNTSIPPEAFTADCNGDLALRVVDSCKPVWDWEITCVSDDGGVTKVSAVVVYDMRDPQNPAETIYLNGVDVTGSFVKVVCDTPLDRELVEKCFQDITDPTIRYNRITVLDLSVTPSVVLETLWFDNAGNIVAAPVNVEACEEMFAPQAIKVCDYLEAVITGNLSFTVVDNTVAIDTTGVLFANDSVRFFWTDFGNGFSDVGNSPSVIYSVDGNYEIKVYAVMASGNKILLYAKEVVVTNGVAVLQGVNPQPVTLNYNVAVGSAQQYYDTAGLPVGTPFNTDGTPYTVVGDLAFECPNLIDDLEDNTEYGGLGANIVECELTNTLNTVSESLDANIGAAASVVAGASPVTTFHPALDTTVNLLGSAPNGVMGAGINVNVGTAVVGAVFTYNLDFISDTDPGDPADFGIVVWDNVAGTSVAATSIVTSLVSSFDAQGVGLNYPLYAIPNPIVNPYTIVWTGDLPVGDYSVLFVGQNQGVTDQVNLLIDYVVPAGVAGTSRALLTALDQCTIDALTPDPVVPVEVQLVKTVTDGAGTITVATGYKSASVTAISGDVTIDSVPVPEGFSWSVDSSSLERYSDTVTVTGTKYILTEVR
jgi:hypothetical protein